MPITDAAAAGSVETPVERLTTNEQLSFIVDKIVKKLQKKINSLDKAKLIVRSVRELHTILSSADDVTSIDVLYNCNICGYLMASYSKLMKYGILVDVSLRCLLPLVRQKSNTLLLHQIVNHGSVVFSLSALRNFESEQSIRVQALELLSTSIDYVTAKTPDGLSVHDMIHQIIVNGGTSILPQLFSYYCELKTDIACIRRVMGCLSFLLLLAPPGWIMIVVSSSNWSCVRSIANVLRGNSDFPVDAKIESAELMIGLIAYSPIAGDKLHAFSAVDEMNSVLINNMTNLKVQPVRLKRAALNLRSLSSMATGSKKTSFDNLLSTVEALHRSHAASMPKDVNPVVEPSLLESDENQNYWPTLSKKKKSSLVERIKLSPLNVSATGEELWPTFPLPLHKKLPVVEKKKHVKKLKGTAAVIATAGTVVPSSSSLPPLHAAAAEENISDSDDDAYVDLMNKVAERLFQAPFGTAASSNVSDPKPTALDTLTYAERLQVMIMQVEKSPGLPM